MKFFILSFLFLFSENQFACAQDSPSTKHIVFNAKVKDTHGHISTGYLYAITDSMVFISHEKQAFLLYPGSINMVQTFKTPNIELIKFNRKGSMGGSILIGAVAGILVGAIAGFASGDDPQNGWNVFALTASQKAVGGGILGGALGSIAGLIAGVAARKTFIIHGRKDKFDNMRNEMTTKLGL